MTRRNAKDFAAKERILVFEVNWLGMSCFRRRPYARYAKDIRALSSRRSSRRAASPC